MNRKLLSYGAVFLMVSALTVLVRTGRSQTPQEKKFDPRGAPYNMVQVWVEVLTLHDGLPEGGSTSSDLVGRRLGKLGGIERDDSGNVVYDRTIEGESQWLAGNVIKVTLQITENDAKRTETILLEGFEPKTLVLNEDPADGRRELLRVIPVFGPNPVLLRGPHDCGAELKKSPTG